MKPTSTAEKSALSPLEAVHKSKKTLTTAQAKALAEKSKLSPRNGKRGKLKTTLLKEEVFKQMQQTLLERSMKLIDTQTILAHGAIKVFKIVTKTIGTGKNAKTYKERPELVSSDEEIASAIGYAYGDEEDPSDDETYYFIVTKDPDNNAIKDQINRVFGKPDSKVDITSKGRQIKSISIVQPS